MARLSVPANIRYRLAWWLPLLKVAVCAALVLAVDEMWPEMVQEWAIVAAVLGAVIGLTAFAVGALYWGKLKDRALRTGFVSRFEQWSRAQTSPAHWAAAVVLTAVLFVVVAAEFISADDARYLLAAAAGALVTVTLGEFLLPARQKWWRVEERPAFRWSAIDTGLTRGQAKALAERLEARLRRGNGAAVSGAGDASGSGINFADLDQETLIEVGRSWMMYGLFAMGAASLTLAYYALGTDWLWVSLPCGLFGTGIGVWLLQTHRLWRVNTVRGGRRSLVFDGMTLQAANDMAQAIRDAGGLRKRALKWKLPAGGRKGFWGAGSG